MRERLLRDAPYLVVRDPIGIKTTSITQHTEGKTDRGVMRLVSREKLKAGGYRLQYEGAFRDDTWADVIAMWHERWGAKHRAGWEPTTEEAVT